MPDMPPEALYTPEILRLATMLPPFDKALAADADGDALAHSRRCGSRVRAWVVMDDAGRVRALTQDVHACALGQAAAAIVAARSAGCSLKALEQGRAALHVMLKEGAPPPAGGRWRALAALLPVRDFPPRHEAVLLPFDAAIGALRRALQRRGGGNGAGNGGGGDGEHGGANGGRAMPEGKA